MNTPQPTMVSAVVNPGGDQSRRRVLSLALLLLILVACYTGPLVALVRFAARSDLYSHILLVPFVSAYLIWVERDRIPRNSPGSWTWAASFVALGLAELAVYSLAVARGWHPSANDRLAVMVSSLLLLGGGACLGVLGPAVVRVLAFPLAFLVFMVPFPTFVEHGIEVFFQHTSAFVAYVFLSLSGTPMLNDGLVFRLPGIRIRVAEECSGIHSSLVLFITSLLGGQLFLRSPWKRAALALAVIPLGILRNGFRIFTIGMLCAHVSPDMINSLIHRKGGPVFFLLSLVPFFLFLLWLRRSERPAKSSLLVPTRAEGSGEPG